MKILSNHNFGKTRNNVRRFLANAVEIKMKEHELAPTVVSLNSVLPIIAVYELHRIADANEIKAKIWDEEYND